LQSGERWIYDEGYGTREKGEEALIMKKFLWAGLAAAIGTMLMLPFSPAGTLKTIQGIELEAMMADGTGLVIVDVREPELFAAGHIRGAVNIPYDDAKPRIVKELSPEDRIVFVCHGGPMGDELGKLLVAKGYPDVYNLAGGMKKWKGEVVR
jgi:rhodanese-related sulfurtransferase